MLAACHWGKAREGSGWTESGSMPCRAPEVMRRPNAELKEKFADLLQYRDRIFKDYFPK